MRKLADKMRDCIAGYFTPDINGAKYGYGIYADGQCEIFDTVEDDDYRIEKFGSVEVALTEFKINGRPILEFVSGILPMRKR